MQRLYRGATHVRERQIRMCHVRTGTSNPGMPGLSGNAAYSTIAISGTSMSNASSQKFVIFV